MSDDNVTRVLQMLTALGVFLGPILLAYLNNRTAIAQAKATAQVKARLETVTTDTAKHLDVIEKTGEKTHTLVNSNMGVQLRMHADLTQRMAEKTKEPEDIAAALQAKKLWDEHQGKQATVDAAQKASGLMPPLPDTHDFNDNPGAWDKPEPRSDT